MSFILVYIDNNPENSNCSQILRDKIIGKRWSTRYYLFTSNSIKVKINIKDIRPILEKYKNEMSILIE